MDSNPILPSDDQPPLPETQSSPGRGELRSPSGRRTSPELLRKLGTRFDIRGVLGEGGMGIVFRAIDRESGRELALKVVHTERLSGTGRERFTREGQITASLNHPGILRVHTAGEIDGIPFLAYELVEGAGTLDDAQGFDLVRKVELVRDVAQALGAAHAQGVIHRDVKPENILLDASGRPRVADFGLAAAQGLSRLTQSGAMVGTPYYMAPEQLAGQRDLVGPACDVWGLGVVLYQLLTDTLPFDGTTLGELRANISVAQPERPRAIVDSIPEDLEAVCLMALARDATLRYPDGAAFAEDLDNWLHGRAVGASSNWQGLRELSRGTPKGLAWATVAVGILLGTLVWVLNRQPTRAVDNAPPTLQLEPLADQVLGASVELRGQVEDASPWVELSVGRTTTRVVPGKPFVIEVPLRKGPNELWLRAVDAAGNRGESRKLRVERARVPDWFAALPVSSRPPPPLPEALRVGESVGEYLHPRDGSVLVWIPPGEFCMGAEAGDVRAESNERPRHTVRIGQGFFLGKYELSQKQFNEFCRRTQRSLKPQPFSLNDPDRHPAVQLTWNDTQAYCTWARLRLPTEAEWEWAARGPDGRDYPWGSEVPQGTDRCNRRGLEDGYERSSPIGSYPDGASPFGALDMAGNVWEWVQDRFGPYPSEPQLDPRGPKAGVDRVHRGGAWSSSVDSCRAAQRAQGRPDYSNVGLGMRVALSP